MNQPETPLNSKDELRLDLENWEVDHHVCDDEGFGCLIEEFTGTWPGATGIYYRCKLKREEMDELVQIVNLHILRAQQSLLKKLNYDPNDLTVVENGAIYTLEDYLLVQESELL
jgi:hypothetical protein